MNRSVRTAFITAVSCVALAALTNCDSDSDTTTPGTGGSGAASTGGSEPGGSNPGGFNPGGSGGSSTGGNTGGSATGGSGGMAGAGGGSGGMAGAGGGTGGAVACVPQPCEQSKVYECADCIDNDGDGLFDADDDNCLGPCDNNEAGLHLQIPGANSAPCKNDCYFDKDSGAGNDNCNWDHRCDPFEPSDPVECPYSDPPPSSANCPVVQDSNCLTLCEPLTPNGCDCFGCCELPGGSGNWVFLGTVNDLDEPTCTIANASDHTLCKLCTPVPNCFNGCGDCELCLGKVFLPPECFEPGAEEQCPGGEQPCGLAGQPPCPSGYYCITGCCQPLPT